MESHPTYKDVQAICQKYPKLAGSFFQVYNDILLSQGWKDVKVIDVEQVGRAVICGKRKADEPELVVVPCALSESISIEW
ncbi:hypothetical protein FRC03_004151 [Tulasnella sp. 419]|nr:hypothetical protein FRC03_004151 [Tulasnella sp. 419]